MSPLYVVVLLSAQCQKTETQQKHKIPLLDKMHCITFINTKLIRRKSRTMHNFCLLKQIK